MTATLIFLLIVIDLLLLGVVFYLGKQRIKPMDILREIHDEKRVLKELRVSVSEELKNQHQNAKTLYDKIAKIAAEAELELKNSSSVFAEELEKVLDELGLQVSSSFNQIAKERSSLSSLIQKAKDERFLLAKHTKKSEKLVKFFDKKIPYQEVLEEIEDKKYIDARQLLGRGMSVSDVSIEVGLAESEVRMISSLI